MDETLTEKIEKLPALPGVYLFKDAEGKVIYVGKARSIRNRVKSYFHEGCPDFRYHTRFLRERISDIDYIITNSEKEAILLENNLIKKHRPRYNVVFRDDKNFLSIRIDPGEKFPYPMLVRRIKDDGALYFGPYSSSHAVRQTLSILHKIFPLRSCNNIKFRNHSERPCVLYQIRRCSGPCCGLIDEERYKELLNDAIRFLRGESKELLDIIRKKMIESAEKMDYERAAIYRDQILSLEKTVERQSVVYTKLINIDVIGMSRIDNRASIQVLQIRDGKMVGGRHWILNINREIFDEEIVSSFLSQYYATELFIPERIIIPVEIGEKEIIENWLSERKGSDVVIIKPKKGENLKLLRMAEQNAHVYLHEKGADSEKALVELCGVVSMKRVPKRIEVFDVSNIHGRYAVGSMIVYENNSFSKGSYRRFRIKTVEGIDDYAMLYEILKRRFERAKTEGNNPDLIVIDGGAGHLNVALEVLREVAIDNVHVIAIGKGRRTSGRRRVEDRDDAIYLPGRKGPLFLSHSSPCLLLLKKLRDEAHRFAITYHKRVRAKSFRSSILDDIKGIGSRKKALLLKHFGDIESIARADEEEISKIPGINRKLASRIVNMLREKYSSERSE